jgi:hypothetical protein
MIIPLPTILIAQLLQKGTNEVEIYSFGWGKLQFAYWQRYI